MSSPPKVDRAPTPMTASTFLHIFYLQSAIFVSRYCGCFISGGCIMAYEQ